MSDKMIAYPQNEGSITSTGAKQRLYRLKPPLTCAYKTVEYVIVSSLYRAFDTSLPETLIFEANKDGKVQDWGRPLIGSNRISDSHEYALKNAGYEVVTKD